MPVRHRLPYFCLPFLKASFSLRSQTFFPELFTSGPRSKNWIGCRPDFPLSSSVRYLRVELSTACQFRVDIHFRFFIRFRHFFPLVDSNRHLGMKTRLTRIRFMDDVFFSRYTISDRKKTHKLSAAFFK